MRIQVPHQSGDRGAGDSCCRMAAAKGVTGTVLQDLVCAARSLRRGLALAFVAVGTIALGEHGDLQLPLKPCYCARGLTGRPIAWSGSLSYSRLAPKASRRPSQSFTTNSRESQG